jgi:hypothetical protein
LGRWSALTLERTLSDPVNEAYGLTSAEIALMWQTAPATPPAQGWVVVQTGGLQIGAGGISFLYVEAIPAGDAR